MPDRGQEREALTDVMVKAAMEAENAYDVACNLRRRERSQELYGHSEAAVASAAPVQEERVRDMLRAALAVREEPRAFPCWRAVAWLNAHGTISVARADGRRLTVEDYRWLRERLGMTPDADTAREAKEPTVDTERPDGLIVQWVCRKDVKPGDKALDLRTNLFRRIAVVYKSGEHDGYKLGWEGDPPSEAWWAEELLLVVVGQIRGSETITVAEVRDTEQEPER